MDIQERLESTLSDRYRIIREIGQGGMATVFLAEDLKHHRSVAIKVLNPDLAAAVGADRFLKEIEIAAGLSHPHILPLHDSGESSGLLFYVMPFVEGESLRAKLDREKQLPLEEALRIAREVADALAFAHGKGVIHRDIKPANILLEGGHAVVADFGVARAVSGVGDTRLTDTGLAVGTPGYMSPEQASGQEVDARSDLYSLGCVIYEMLGGDPPFQASTPQAMLARKLTEPVPPLQTVRDTVPDDLERTIERALARVPADRFPGAGELRDALAESELTVSGLRPAVAPPRRRRWSMVAAIGTAVVIGSILITTQSLRGGIDFNARDEMLLADPDNNTGDEVFDRSLLHALTVAIDQSQYVNVFPRNRVQEVLRRMNLDSVPRIDVPLALEIAEREDIKAVLALEISEVGGAYLLSTTILDPYTREAVRSRQVTADGKGQVLGSLDELATRVRRDLGESLRQIQQRALPLPKATTSSLDALKLYADGSFAWSQNRWQEARTLWSRAVELDSGFAWANASLGLAEDWIGSSDLSRQYFDRALGQLDRVTEKERLWIIALSSGGEEGVEAYRTYLQQYPDDRDGWYNLGNNLRFVGRVEEAMEAYEMSLAVDSLNPWAHVNLGVGLDGLGRPEEAVEHFRQVEALDPGQLLNWRGDVNRISGFVLAKVGDTLGARTRFEALLSRGDEARANGLRSLALLEMHRGRHTQALDLLDQAIVNLQRADLPLSVFRNRIYRAQALSSLGRSDDLRLELALAQVLAETGGWDPGWVVHLARLQVDAGELEAAREWLNRWRQDGESEGPNQWALELVRGEIRLAEGNAAGAAEAIQLSDRLTRVPGGLVKAALGRALLGAGRLEEASEALREAIRLRTLGLEGQESWVLSHYWLGRALADQGRPAEALPYLERFIELWGGGDPELQGVGEARALLESLASNGESAG